MTTPLPGWHLLKKYCGSGIEQYSSPPAPFVEPPEDDAHTEGSEEQKPNEAQPASTPYGVRVNLVDNYKTTPAERAGIKSGDIITHAHSPSGWVAVHDWDDLRRYGVGPVGKPQRFLVQTPGEDKPREVIVSREWIVHVPYYAYERTMYTPDQLQAVIAAHLHDIPKRSNEDDTCELMASVPLGSLMSLAAPHPHLTRTPTTLERT